MNKKGRKKNLEPSHPGNTNAQKSGVHSPRRRAAEEAKVREAMAEDPRGFLAADQSAMYAETRGLLKLLEDDIAERGVTDRSGKQRRQVGTHMRALSFLADLNSRMQAELTAKEQEGIPWNFVEALQVLIKLARDPGKQASARISAIRLWHELNPDAGKKELKYDPEYMEFLAEMSDEELERELELLRVPVTTDPKPTLAESLIRRLAAQPEMTDEEFRVLQQAIAEELATRP